VSKSKPNKKPAQAGEKLRSSSTLKMEAMMCFYETEGDLQTACRYNPQDLSLIIFLNLVKINKTKFADTATKIVMGS
jgi:hypothetical protein